MHQAGGHKCRVQRAMAIPPLNHRDPWFGPWLVQLQADTRVIYNTDQARPCNLNHASACYREPF